MSILPQSGSAFLPASSVQNCAMRGTYFEYRSALLRAASALPLFFMYEASLRSRNCMARRSSFSISVRSATFSLPTVLYGMRVEHMCEATTRGGSGPTAYLFQSMSPATLRTTSLPSSYSSGMRLANLYTFTPLVCMPPPYAIPISTTNGNPE